MLGVASERGEVPVLAARRELTHWEADAEGALALLLLMDQIPRNIFRNSAHSFATDALAQSVALRAIVR